MKNAVFWDVKTCGSCKNRRFGGTYGIHNQGDRIRELGTTLAVTSNRRTLRRTTITENHIVFLGSVRRLLVTANVVPSSAIFLTLMMEELNFSETLQEPHGVTSQKTALFIVTAVETQKLT
jgi:hypothetical protein